MSKIPNQNACSSHYGLHKSENSHEKDVRLVVAVVTNHHPTVSFFAFILRYIVHEIVSDLACTIAPYGGGRGKLCLLPDFQNVFTGVVNENESDESSKKFFRESEIKRLILFQF